MRFGWRDIGRESRMGPRLIFAALILAFGAAFVIAAFTTIHQVSVGTSATQIVTPS